MTVATVNRGRLLVTCFLLFFLSLFLAAYSARNPALSDAGYVVVSEVLNPMQSGVQQIISYLGKGWETYARLLHVEHENELLKARLYSLEVENSRLMEWESEIKRLRSLLSIAEQEGLKGVAADVVGYDPSMWVQSITVNRGSADGITRNQAVIQGNFVVGHVVAAGLNSSRILLITDHSSGVDSIVQSSRARGVIEGLGTDFCELNYVQHDQEVTVGDRIVTSGMDEMYPKGLVVGVVSDVQKRGTGMFQTIKVKPSVQFSRLETVLIVTSISGTVTQAVGPPAPQETPKTP